MEDKNPPADPITGTGLKPLRSEREERRDLLRVMKHVRFALVVLALLAGVAALYAVRLVVLPFVVAIFLKFLLNPPVRSLTRSRVGRAALAGVVVTLFVGGIATTGYLLAEPAASWLRRAPASLREAQAKIREVARPVEKLKETAQKVEDATDVTSRDDVPVVAVRGPSLTERFLGQSRDLVFMLVTVIVFTFFLLAGGDMFLEKFVRILPRHEHKERARRVGRQIERDVSAYLLTVTVINACLGVAVALAMEFLGMPNPILWGVLAAVLNFVPYVGAFVVLLVIGAVSLLSFEELGKAIVPPLTFLALTSLEGQLITPFIVGNRLSLNPVAILLGLMFFSWMFGLIGALLAVPLLTVVKIICDNVDPLKPVGEFFGKAGAETLGAGLRDRITGSAPEEEVRPQGL